MKKYLLFLFALTFFFVGCSSENALFTEGLNYEHNGDIEKALQSYNKALKKISGRSYWRCQPR